MSGRGGGGQAGSVSLVGLGLAAVVLVAAMVVLDVGLLAAGRAQAQTAADLAALAAVTPGQAGAAQERARVIAAANQARLAGYAGGHTGRGPEAVVSVARPVRLLPFGLVVEVRARARAVLPLPVELEAASRVQMSTDRQNRCMAHSKPPACFAPSSTR